MVALHLDVETRSVVDLRQTGAYVYAEDPSTDVWCVAYAFGDEPIELRLPGQPCPPRIAEHVENDGLIYCHNAQFERLIWRHVLGPKHGWPVPDLRQFRCTLAMAYAMALPGSLDGAAAALQLSVQKDMVAHRTMLQLSKPRRIEDGKPVWWDLPEKLERLYGYCINDVEVERALEKRLLALRPLELEIWFLDQEINDRGVYIDAKLCHAAKGIVKEAIERLNAELREITGGAVLAVSNVNQLTGWLDANGVPAKSLAKDQLEELLALDLPSHCRRALEIRREGAKTSTAKIDKMLKMRCADGRMRGNLQYHGAGTGRWAARGAQLQNLPRPVSKNVDELIAAIETGSLDWLEMVA